MATTGTWRLTAEMVRWLHISVLELVATGFSTVIFGAMLPPTARLGLGSGRFCYCHHVHSGDGIE